MIDEKEQITHSALKRPDPISSSKRPFIPAENPPSGNLPPGCEISPTSDDKKKRYRRTANEISRHYICPQPGCGKSYGSEGSLNQHLKLKHKGAYPNGLPKKQVNSSGSGEQIQNPRISLGQEEQEKEESKSNEGAKIIYGTIPNEENPAIANLAGEFLTLQKNMDKI